MTFQSFKDAMSASMPALAVECVTRTRDVLRHSSADIALAHDRTLVFQLAETLMNHGRHFEACLTKELMAVAAGPGKAGDAGTKPASVLLDDVGLVDEQQAEAEIVLAQIVHLIDLKAEWELREMDAYMATLLETPVGSVRKHPFQPASFAAALAASMNSLGLAPDEKRLLLRLSGNALADLLKKLYAKGCADLHREGIRPQPFKVAAAASRPAAPDAAAAHPPGELQTLLDRFPAVQVQPSVQSTSSVSPGATPAPTAAASGLSITFKSIDIDPVAPSFKRTSKPATAPQLDAFMAALFKQLGVDNDVPPDVKALISQLEPCLRKAARLDPRLTNSTQHPAWRFINELAQHASGYAQTDAQALAQLVSHVRPMVTELNRLPSPGAAHFDAAARALQRHVEERSRQVWQQRGGAMAHLQSADQRLALEPVVRQQIVARLVGLDIDLRVREFLLGTWVRVLTHVLANEHDEGPRTQGLLNAVEDLLKCLEPSSLALDRAALRERVPELLQRMQDGMARIAVPMPEQQALIERLSKTLAPLLHAGHSPSTHHHQQPAGLGANLAWGDDEPGHYGSAPSLNVDTSIGSLPTVPMGLGSEGSGGRGADSHAHEADARASTASPQGWARALTVGAWCKISLQGQWATAQVLWISNHREFFVFKPSHALQLQSISRKALERLRAEGLATQLNERKLVQRAVDSLLLQDI